MSQVAGWFLMVFRAEFWPKCLSKFINQDLFADIFKAQTKLEKIPY